MKTPDEIKKGLEECTRLGGCVACPYFDRGIAARCTTALAADALAIINQLESKLAEYEKPLVPVVHGRWINQDNTYTKYQCSACKERNFDGVGRYCPNCGAKMDGERDKGD